MMTSSNENFFCVTGPLCGELTVTGEFPSQRPVKRSFDVLFDRRLNKRDAGDLRSHRAHYDVIAVIYASADWTIIPCAQRSCWGGILVSHRPSVCPSVRPSCIPGPLCSPCSSVWIHFIFIHLIKQRQKVCRMWSSLKKIKIWIFWQFFKICNFDFVFFWLGI